jgi:cell division protein FtsL
MSEEKNISTEKNNSFKELTSAQMLGLIVFIGILALPYIYNSHQSDKKHRESEKIKSELKELRAEYITLKSEIVGQNKQSDVAKRLEDKGIQPISSAPTNLNTPDD